MNAADIPWNNLCGIKVFTNPYMTESESYEEVVDKTWRERFIEPLLQFRFREFRPWIKTKTITWTRQVPSKKALMSGGSLMVHPVMLNEIKKQLEGTA